MRRNNRAFLNFLLSLSLVAVVVPVSAQTSQPQVITPGAPNATAKSKSKKKIKINFEDETVTGNYDLPDTMFLNSRRLIKYKELFNKRTNFIEEIESNKGLFNEHQK